MVKYHDALRRMKNHNALRRRDYLRRTANVRKKQDRGRD